MMSILRGVATVTRRRGLTYLRYLATGVAWPRVAYAALWGPPAPKPARALFHGLTAVPAQRPDQRDLTALGIMMDEGEAAGGPPGAADVEGLMNRLHAAGITGLRHAFDTLATVPDGSVRLRSLAGLRRHARRGIVFAAERDGDRVAFNTRFNASLMTEALARRLLRERKAAVPIGYRNYAPIDFGGGLTIGRIASSDSGTGRWDVFNRHIVAPLVAGRRVLDLGSNNGSLPLMMLRAGARAVVAVEGSRPIVEFARLNAEILQWRDMRAYDFRVVHGDMRLFLTEELGAFDVVTAFCSLYYLPPADMAQVIAKAAAIGATLVLQSNDAITGLPARTGDLREMMASNGYPRVKVHEFPGFSRSLLVGLPDPVAAASRPVHQRQFAGAWGA